MSGRRDHGSVEFEVDGELVLDDVGVLSDESWDLVAQLEASGLTRTEAEEHVRSKKERLREALRRQVGKHRAQ